MGFVYEQISEEKGQALYDKFHFTVVGGWPVIPRNWLADKERNAFLVPVGAQKGDFRHDLIDIPAVHNLIWNDQPIKIEYYSLSNEHERTIKFYVKGIGIPQSLAGQEDEVISLAKEAVLAYFWRGQEPTDSAKVTIEEEPTKCYIWAGPYDKEQQ